MNKDIIEVIKSKKLLNSLGPSNMLKIKKAERKLKLKFSEEYIKYLLEFGAVAYYGTELSGLLSKKEEREYLYFNVVRETLEEKKCDNTIPDNMYVIENLGVDGALAWQDESGTVYYKYRFDNRLQKAADSLAEYLELQKLDESDFDIIEKCIIKDSYSHITNYELVKCGHIPFDTNGEKIELHHMGQMIDGPLVELTRSDLCSKDGYGTFFAAKKQFLIDRDLFEKERKQHWLALAGI